MDYIKQSFTFDLDTIFNVARLYSAKIASHVISQDGTSQESKLALTDADRVLWDVSVRYPANTVYNYLMSAGKVQDNGYQFGVLVSGKKSIIYTLYLHPDWDKNLSRGLNDSIEKAIVYGGLADWFKLSGSAAYEMAKQEYDTALKTCSSTINQRKYKTFRKHITF